MLEVNKASLYTLIQIFGVWDKNFVEENEIATNIAELFGSYKIS